MLAACPLSMAAPLASDDARQICCSVASIFVRLACVGRKNRDCSVKDMLQICAKTMSWKNTQASK